MQRLTLIFKFKNKIVIIAARFWGKGRICFFSTSAILFDSRLQTTESDWSRCPKVPLNVIPMICGLFFFPHTCVNPYLAPSLLR